LARLGRLDVVRAEDADLGAAQALRHEAFLAAGCRVGGSGVDADAFDPWCDHLLVLDRSARGEAELVATCRMMRTPAGPGFASATHFDIETWLDEAPAGCCEIGRACVRPGAAGGPAVAALFAGLFAYARCHRIACYFGAASFVGSNAAEHLSTLAPIGNAVGRLPVRPRAGFAAPPLDPGALPLATSRHTLPPLIRAYLGLGARIGIGAAIDRRFGTTDIFVAVMTTNLPSHYRRHFLRATALPG
jgi:putative hemolysin